MNSSTNVDDNEVAQFDALSDRWWDREGPLRTLHDLNPARSAYIKTRAGPLAGKATVDVGCGGGILSEALAEHGAEVTGIDLSANALATARLHLYESGHTVHYEHTSAEAFANQRAGQFALVTCLELLEHVPEPASTIAACAQLAAPGADIFFSTIHRNAKAYLMAILGAEYALGLLPRGTHDYQRFIKPSELERSARQHGLALQHITGLKYNPFNHQAALTRDVSVNYIAHFKKPPRTL